MLKILLEINTPEQINEENKRIIPIYKRYNYVNKKYERLLDKAKKIAARSSRLLFFQYGGSLSISGEIANELFYHFPDKIVVVAYIKGTKVNCSLRGLGNVRDLAAKALYGIESNSGGHESASGATFQLDDLRRFKENLMRLMMQGQD
jgi:single-stranded DNA-specific DHH superfamily exonuclease